MDAGVMCLHINSGKMDGTLWKRGGGGWAECTSSLCWIQSIYYLLFNNRQISLNQFIT